MSSSPSPHAATPTSIIPTPSKPFPLLELPLDIVFMIFDLWRSDDFESALNVSLSSKLLQWLSTAWIFRSINVWMKRTQIYRFLRDIRGNEKVLAVVRSFTIRIKRVPEAMNEPFDNAVLVLFAEVLCCMNGLKELMLDLVRGGSLFADAFHASLRERTLPSVETFWYRAAKSPGSISEVLPNAHRFSLGVSDMTKSVTVLRDLSSHPHLNVLELQKCYWSLRDVEVVVALCPQCPASATERWTRWGKSFDTNPASNELIPAIRLLPRLQKLAIDTDQIVPLPPRRLEPHDLDDIMSQIENHPLNEKPRANALKFFQQCHSLLRVYLSPCWFRPVRKPGERLRARQVAPDCQDMYIEWQKWMGIPRTAKRRD
ncbi:hypothetical protein BDP55DRAFT_720954 [Colletotrichum godetiae]|uniref:Uncharacterized protein n=1 Tax=Colletotrichum godetiae TaxID=1209918 RepID=A0AAJ0AAL5_9PEZI|nr:uncharacterized protein BDP55DRAFT_720954 [Colletotrichum godetiae]KAK1658072.1 hypothetical protein BDP55DRAFT_720954 [Colletotrichum godetiae]